MRRILLALAGVVLCGIGILGLILPVMPGWPLIFVGLSLIAPSFAMRLKRRLLRRLARQRIFWIRDWESRGVTAGFTTRHFPLVCRNTGDLSDPAVQSELRRHMAEALKGQDRACGNFIYLNQVHGDRIEVVDQPAAGEDGFSRLEQCDGVITNLAGRMLIAMTADCLPVFLLAGSGSKAWIGLVHAGWRGTAKEIVPQALKRICEQSGCPAEEVRIFFGPSIRATRYEVGDEFKQYFPWQGPQATLHLRNGRWYFDLAGENRRQLLAAGANARHLKDLEMCTVDENEDFYSFRVERERAGRMISFMVKREG